MERDPKFEPGDNQCQNPEAVSNFKCTLWGLDIGRESATNNGHFRSQFRIGITASNGTSSSLTSLIRLAIALLLTPSLQVTTSVTGEQNTKPTFATHSKCPAPSSPQTTRTWARDFSKGRTTLASARRSAWASRYLTESIRVKMARSTRVACSTAMY
jgi:hypothetical protein